MVIFAFWLSSFTSFNATPQKAIASAMDKVGSPGQSLIAGVGSFFADIKDLFFGSKKITYSEIEVGPGRK
jgi:cell shape-determining protein MreC